MIVIVVAIVVVLAGVAMGWRQANRSKRLRDSFGPEYDRALDERAGSSVDDRAIAGGRSAALLDGTLPVAGAVVDWIRGRRL